MWGRWKGGHTFGQLAGLSVRGANCPLEMNLMPSSARTQQECIVKPYFYAAAACFVLRYGRCLFQQNRHGCTGIRNTATVRLSPQYKLPHSKLQNTLGEVEK